VIWRVFYVASVTVETMLRFQPQINGNIIDSPLQSDIFFNITFAHSVTFETMLRFQPQINGNIIDSTLQSDIFSTSLFLTNS